ALHALGRHEEAQATFTVAVDFKPDLAEAHLGLATVLQRRGRLDAALDAYSTGLELAPNSPGPWAELGGLLQHLARPADARDAFGKAHAQSPHSFAARWHLCTCHLAPLHRSQAELDAARAGYARDLDALAQIPTPDSEDEVRTAADALAQRLPFYLAAQGH